MDHKKMENRLNDDMLEKVSGGAGNEYYEITEGFRYKWSTRASWCPYCQTNVEPDSVCSPQMFSGIRAQIFSCEHCNGEYIARV